jgi:pimeloyl-ACP methyl ester carboxylesterase
VTENIAGVGLPSLLIVPGAWFEPEHFCPLRDELSDIDVHTVKLTSSGKDPAVLGDMYSDAEAIVQAAAAIDGPVVVVAHSYGGIPTTQGLAHAKNVRRIIYIAAFQLSAGESLQSLQGGSLMPWSMLHHRDGIDDYVEAMTPETVFFNDVDTLTARRAVSQLGYQSYASMRQPLTETAWRTIPSTYVICERDNALPVAVQEVLAEHADDVQRMSTSHSPFLSQPAALARIIRRSLARSSATKF